MQFTTLALSALSICSALAQSAGIKVHVVRVGAMNGSLIYSPDNIKAAVGEMVQFQFAPNNHSVTQSTFDQPCQPIAPAGSSGAGIYSGFMPVSASSTTTPTYTIMIKDQTPMWLYCSQAQHCQGGMVMVINEDTAANASRTLENYRTLAKASTASGTAVGDQAGTNSTSGTAPGTGTGAGSLTSTPIAASQTAAAPHLVRASSTLGLVLTIGLAFLL
ncbi:uncharacterized protein L3040_003982 [Drepanopeziza brunnea f. sp. 'multigermtubi']|uniref:uncharacterized protein n=1 Tax=Drepanopeziza brunnea f. sp. 'multigermtubi' TaxID=698441 RepID=UPI0023981786|nr:hypothetical protein L3040_003982 [Drepanopeziza brunnea f. sp. 'multigermtubi']